MCVCGAWEHKEDRREHKLGQSFPREETYKLDH